MKKYLFGLIAIFLAIGTLSFTKATSTNYFWYNRINATTYVADGTTATANPSISCLGVTVICSKGFTDQLTQEEIDELDDADTSNDERKKPS